MPVYNAGKFLEEAVESVINLPQVQELILIEDGSKDNSLEVAKHLYENHDKISLYVHDGNQNKGAGASRNLGIKKAKQNYIAFLDADDKYLKNRFEKDVQILKDSNIDGVYSRIGSFSSENSGLKRSETGINERLAPENLFEEILTKSHGINTLGVTLKKSILEELEGFNENLRLHQDSELWFRLAFHYNLVGASIDNIVALRREHPNNRIKGKNGLSKLRFNSVLLRYYSNQKIKKELLIHILKKHIDSVYKSVKKLPLKEKLEATGYLLKDLKYYFIVLIK